MYALREVAVAVGAVPIVWLWMTRNFETQWAFLASAFFISFLADLSAHLISPAVISVIYPVSQAALFGAVLLTRRDAWIFLGTLTLTAVVSLLWRGPEGPEVLLRTVAMLGVAGIVFDRWQMGTLRTALLTYCGLGWCAWVVYMLLPAWPSWAMYQSARLAGIVLFCWAASHPALRLHVVRSRMAA